MAPTWAGPGLFSFTLAKHSTIEKSAAIKRKFVSKALNQRNEQQILTAKFKYSF